MKKVTELGPAYWERFLAKLPEGAEYYVAPNWSQDSWRNKISRMAKKGYFKREARKGRAYGDWFRRTNKQYVEGDSPNKPIEYSKVTTPHPLQAEVPTI